MKYYLFFVMIFCGSGLNIDSYAYTNDESTITGFFSFQKDPFYFLNPVPSKIKLPNKIDLSFFRNQLIVFQYRYRLEIPKGVETTIERKLTNWSGWNNSDLTPVIIPRLDQEGGYKLVIEYKTQPDSETKRFEKLFYVYRIYPASGYIASNNNTTFETAAEKKPVNVTATTKKANESDINKTTKPVPAADNSPKGKNKVNDRQIDLKDVRIRIDIIPQIVPYTGNISEKSSSFSAEAAESIAPDYDSLLAVAIETNDTVLFGEAIRNGAGTGIKGGNGGNIFHLLDGNIASEELIVMLKNNGFSINEADYSGNSPLHLAILKGENRYLNSLVNQGAYLNIRNNMLLSPLHLAVFLGDEVVVKDLIRSGAAINLKGNTGYTPLHIASQMNYIEIAKNLLINSAKIGIKTDQGLSAKEIARIQNYPEMVKLISKRGFDTISPPKSSYSINRIVKTSERQIPDIDFNLPYDKELAKKRQLSKVIQIISVPVFILSTAGIAYLKSEANHYYSLSKIAETEEMAKYYYDKTAQYDKYAYISGGVSLVSVYGFIHSTVRKKTISGKMHKSID